MTASGTGQAFDPGYSANFRTETATNLRFRDDYQFSTAPMYSGTGGFRLVPGSYTVFGNNGSTGNTGNVNQSGNTSLNDLGANKSTILTDLTTDTDHLPVVADYSFSLPAATISLTIAVNATIITGGTATFGATLANSASAGASDLNYTLSAAVTVGSAGLGSASPSSGTLAPSATQAFTVAATSTLLGSNTISLTASDPNASNSPQTINATLTVLDHAAGSAMVTAGNGFLVRAGATGLTATISVSDAAGGRSSLQISAAPSIGGGSLNSGPTVPYFVPAGSAQTYMATFSAGNTAGICSNTVTFASAGDNQSLPGASTPGTLSVTITGNVYSGNAVWTGSATSWTTVANWLDADGGPAAPPGGDGVFGHDTATFANSGATTAIDLIGVNPNLQALSFSSSDYTLSNGSLTLQSSTGTAAVTVASNKHAIASSTILTLASPVEVCVAEGAELDIDAEISEASGSQLLKKDGSGTLVLSGTNNYTGGTFVEAGTLAIASIGALPDGARLTVGSAAAFAPVIQGSDPIMPVPEPRTLALMLAGAALMAMYRKRR